MPGMLDGRETMLHGEASRLPWNVAVEGPDVVEASVECVRYPLELQRRVAISGSRVELTSTILNTGTSACSVSHGEHPFFGRELFAGGSIEVQVRAAQVPTAMDPENATLAPGSFEWPEARGIDGRVVDLSKIPAEADGTHDHVALELAGPELSIVTTDGLRVTTHVDLDTHPYALFWRNHRAPSAPSLGRWDVFALEPLTAPGRSVDDGVAAGKMLELQPGAKATFACAVTVSR
jgi:galactose mutarotase-like enzyme